MVVSNLQNSHRRNFGDINPSVLLLRERVVVWLKNEPVRTPEVEGVLSCAIFPECMAPAGHIRHGGERFGRQEGRQPPLDDAAVAAPAPGALALLRACLLQFLVREAELDPPASSSSRLGLIIMD